MATYVLGISGGSGAPYALRVLEGLLGGGHHVFAVCTDAGRKVFELELGIILSGRPAHDESELRNAACPKGAPGSLTVLDVKDIAASIASGSYKTDGMVIVPCSMGTLGRVAVGIGSSLLERAADVMLKERRRLILVPREAPLSLVHLRNMIAVAEAGAIIFPATPGFYHSPKTVQDLVDSVAGRVLDLLGVETAFLKRWTGPAPAEVVSVTREEE